MHQAPELRIFFNHSLNWVGIILILSLIVINPPLYGGTIVGSRHDLSSGSSPEICIFCHTAHNANPDVEPRLWNRAGTNQVFTPYSSPTMINPPGQPSPVSALCLSCHDGVISQIVVMGEVRDNKHELLNYHGFPDETSYPNCERCHSEMYSGKPSVLALGTDLSNDHPISMNYPIAGEGVDFYTPPNSDTGWGTGDIRLVAGKVECVSCHNVHDPNFVPFLIKAENTCVTCHRK